jgi:sulfite reductase (NADPH) flavoprotein alpha-component
MESLIIRLAESVLLSGPQSPKRVFHLVFEANSNAEIFDHQCGDSIALWPQNNPASIAKILEHFAIPEILPVGEKTVAELLQKQYCISHLSESLLTAVRSQLEAKEGEIFDQYREKKSFATASLMDVIELFPRIKFSAEELLPRLKKMNPRLYSIASARLMHPQQLQLIVAEVVYENFRQQRRYGVASHYICSELAPGDTLEAAMVHSKFKLPSDCSRNVIMVGPGTGVAPFRSFLQERGIRRERGENVGENWLFFGDQHRMSNFYYQQEFERWQSTGNLSHLDLAFSRDQEHKIYVQDRMSEAGRELWDWLERGAYFYICGDAAHMAVDVEAALRDIIRRHGKVADPDGFLRQLKAENRYQRDVY